MPISYSKLPIFLVDDDEQSLDILRSILHREGYDVIRTFTDSCDLLNSLENCSPATIVLDLMMPGISGTTLLKEIRTRIPASLVIVVTAEQQIDTAIECMKLGAIDYLTKPILLKRFMGAIRRASEIFTMNEELDSLQGSDVDVSGVATKVSFVITRNSEMLALLRYVEIIAHSAQPVLVQGETGVGKELIARATHCLSKRSGHFVCVNVAGLDDTLFSDTLFGHKKGSFTGAVSDRDGLLKKAANGTLFLDEIGDLNELSQIKLLRLLQENEFYPLGSDVAIRSAARLVVASNKNLRQQMIEGRFRKDLYYRLCSHQVSIPPLRTRQDDIPLLLDHFIAESAATLGKTGLSYRKELVDLLCTYDFPGNVRELQAMVLDVVTRTTTSKIHVAPFKALISREKGGAVSHENGASARDFGGITFSSFPTLKQAETELIKRALDMTNQNQGHAAQMLGITRQALNNRLRRGKNSSQE